uniref:Protein ENHANCED DISEASE RESISTANCE 2-like n=1 Tax=Kalanchoe fedtschenkoi TaxID=63787 RepID=A0A7N0TLX3_KALFE
MVCRELSVVGETTVTAGDILETEMSDGKMEGWLHLIRFNRFGLQYSRKRYFLLQGVYLKIFKSTPLSHNEEPTRSAIIDSSIRVTDNGRENINKKFQVLFIFTLYNTSNHNDQLKLGASSPEEAARWIRSIQDAASKGQVIPTMNAAVWGKKSRRSFRLSSMKRLSLKSSIDWSLKSFVQVDAMTSDVIAPSPWKIFGCQNGLRLFKEAKEKDSYGKNWDDNPAIMAVGVVQGTSEAIFQTLMSLGSSRSEWDFCFYRGSVVEHLDGHTDIIHKQLYSDWLPRGMKRRDLLLRRYWRREEDGTYVILYHSVFHKKCLPHKGYIRAYLKSGGFVVSPVNQGKQSLVKHMLAIDWKYWKFYLRKASGRLITIRMLERIAALREMFQAKSGNQSSEYGYRERTLDLGVPQSVQEDVKLEVSSQLVEKNLLEEKIDAPPLKTANLMGLSDVTDEFFDVTEPTNYDNLENEWSGGSSPEFISPGVHATKQSSASAFVKKLHELAVQKKGYMDLQEIARDDCTSWCYGDSLAKDTSCNAACTWSFADPSTFLIRGEKYLQDNEKVKANSTLMQMVGADWLRSTQREDDLAGRKDSIVQRAAARGGPEFFFVVNIQVPGTTTYNLALYYMMKGPVEENALLNHFVTGDNTYRNSRFKLIPYISKGSWIVKQSVGKKACLVSQALEVNYFRGSNYLELDIDVGSSTVARGVVNLVLGYLNNLVIEMAFLIQANTQEELPEALLGTCRLNQLDASKANWI